MKKAKSETVFDIFNYIFMGCLVIATIYPLIYVLFASISNPKLIVGFSGLLWKPLGTITLKGYEVTLKNPNILIGYRNTLIYLVVGTIINVSLTSIGAYLVSRKNFYIRKFLTIMMMITMFFSGGIIPMFFVIKNLGMYDTMLSILLPNAISIFNLIIMRTFFYNIPQTLEEAAYIDGATDVDIFLKVVLPLSKPVIAVMVLYYGVAHWNAWFEASIYLRSRDLYPLQLFLREILITNNVATNAADMAEMTEESLYKELIQYCSIIISTVPILCIYPFLQKYFVTGVMIGAVKE